MRRGIVEVVVVTMRKGIVKIGVVLVVEVVVMRMMMRG